MNIAILYGTETGNAEGVAQELAQTLAANHTVQARDLDDCQIDALSAELVLVVLSTYGEGEYPRTAKRFAEQLEAQRPALVGVRYAVFGLGDRQYGQTFGRSSERFDALLASLGAQRVAQRQVHDASSGEFPEDAATAWLEAVLEGLPQTCA
jgi:MioC protein